jgi:hypothetical protein
MSTVSSPSGRLSNAVSVRPIFSLRPENVESLKAVAAQITAKVKDGLATGIEKGNKSYVWKLNENQTLLQCRELYVDADAVLAHLANVEELFAPFLRFAAYIAQKS